MLMMQEEEDKNDYDEEEEKRDIILQFRAKTFKIHYTGFKNIPT